VVVDADKAFRSFWDKGSIDYCESFVVMYLSRCNEVLGIMKVCEGGIDACVVDQRKIFQGALLSNSTSIILAHNHPSGNLKPSQPDVKITNEIAKAGELLKIRVLDHLILTSEGYLSLADEGLI
jgi:DNA repair protein RadC